MTYHEFCETCRDFYKKKLYSKKTLDKFVVKGTLKQHEEDCIVDGIAFDWEQPETT